VQGAQLSNDEFARTCTDQPALFSFWAALPLPHVDAALAELARAFDELGALGVILHCSCLGDSIARAEFDPLFAELDRRRAVVFLHPWDGMACALTTGPDGVRGRPFEDTVAALHLIARQVPRRFAGAHRSALGGSADSARAARRTDGAGEFRGAAERDGPALLLRHRGLGLEAGPARCCAAFGAAQLVPGSDSRAAALGEVRVDLRTCAKLDSRQATSIRSCTATRSGFSTRRRQTVGPLIASRLRQRW
jgi:aminocarboxymuconate-semialdehyde decarboxylase